MDKRIIALIIVILLGVTGVVLLVFGGVDEDKNAVKQTFPIEDQETSLEKEDQTQEGSEPVRVEKPAVEEEKILGTWKHKGDGYIEYRTFSSNGEYGYYAVPDDGTEQGFGGKFSVDDDTVRIEANEGVEELSYKASGTKLTLDGEKYEKVMDSGVNEDIKID